MGVAIVPGAHEDLGARWIVLREGRAPRWGGEARRRHIFARLAERTGATLVEGGWYPVLLRRAAAGALGILPGPLLHRLPRRGDKPKLAASEKLRDRLLDTALAVTEPVAVAIYDEAEAQARALGVALEPDWLAELRRRHRRNVEAFRWLVVPTRSFAELIGLDLDRVIIGGNGTDAARITPGPWPEQPAVGVVSGAAPGRGLELLVEAVRLARGRLPDLGLRMWLVATGPPGVEYIEDLRRSLVAEPWVDIATAPYERLGETLADAWALCIPHPANDYMDVALPVKLFDSLAAGRPLVVTPRRETAALVRTRGVGAVAAGDTAADLATAIADLCADGPRARTLGARARQAAEHEFDWRIVGDSIASELLAREGPRGVPVPLRQPSSGRPV